MKRTQWSIKERGEQEEARQRSGCGSSMAQRMHSKRVRGERGREGKKRVPSTGLQTPAAASTHGAEGALAVVQIPLMLVITDRA